MGRKERGWRDRRRELFWRKEAVSYAGGAQAADGDGRELTMGRSSACSMKNNDSLTSRGC